MAGLDTEVFNTLERALSSDVNDLEALKDRAIQETLRELLEQRIASAIGSWPGAPIDCVLGGLEVVPAGADISVAPGILLQESAVLAPAPGPLDSTYRWARNPTAALLTPAAPGVETWYVVEAQMTQVITSSVVRDVYDVGLGIFVPTLVTKQTERRCAFQITAGVGANAPAPTAGWVPIAILRRPAGGGVVAPEDIIDARPLPDLVNAGDGTNLDASFAVNELRTVHEPNGAVSEEIHLRVRGLVQGRRVEIATIAALDVNVARILDPTTVLAGSTWYYLYLAPWSVRRLPLGSSLAPNAGPLVTSRGVLVLSDVAPAQGTKVNGAVLNLPPPFGGAGTIAASGALCIGALRRNSANTGWMWQQTESGDGQLEEFNVVSGVAVALETIALAGFVPATARKATLRLTWLTSPAAGAPQIGAVRLSPVGAGVGSGYFGNPIVDTGTGDFVLVDVPLIGGQWLPATSVDLAWLVTLPADRALYIHGFKT